jgi:hypothetical protein
MPKLGGRVGTSWLVLKGLFSDREGATGFDSHGLFAGGDMLAGLALAISPRGPGPKFKEGPSRRSRKAFGVLRYTEFVS